VFKADSQDVGCEARVASVAVGKRMDSHESMMKPDAKFDRLVRRVLDLTFDGISSPSSISPPELGELSHALETAQYLDEDAAALAAYALRCYFSGAAEDAVFAAQRAYDACDHEAQQLIESNVITSADEAMILAHPNIQHELSGQRSDLDELETSPRDFRNMVLRARQNAMRL